METKNSNKIMKEQIGEVVFNAAQVFVEGMLNVSHATNKDLVNALAMFDKAVIKMAADKDEDNDTGMQALLYVLNNKEYL